MHHVEGVVCIMLGVWCVACWGCGVHHVEGVVCSMLGVWCASC